MDAPWVTKIQGSAVAQTQLFLLLCQHFRRIPGFLLSLMLPYKPGSLRPGPAVPEVSLQLQAKASHFACMAASASQADLYETLPPSTICIGTKIRGLHKTEQENHLSVLSEKGNGMDTLHMFTMKCFLSLRAIEFVHKRKFALFSQPHNPICLRLTRVTSTSLELHSWPTEQRLALLNYFPAIMKCYSAALGGTRP